MYGRKIITLLTDFGANNPYIASMKGVMLKINPDITIIDISHNVQQYNIQLGAIILWASYKYFPEGTIHVVVIDPGVGTKRKAIIIETNNYYFVGPDNGVLTLAAYEDGIKNVYEIYIKSKYVLQKISYTFHGRDIFAPVAAYLSKNIKPDNMGKKTKLTTSLHIPMYKVINNVIVGKVIYIDDFGNVVTNIPADLIDNKLLYFDRYYTIKIVSKVIKAKLVKAYDEVGTNEPLLIPDSFNLIEFSINKGNAAKKYSVNIGDEITLELC